MSFSSYWQHLANLADGPASALASDRQVTTERSIDDEVERFLARFLLDEETLIRVVQQLRTSYRRQYRKELFDAESELSDRIFQTDYTEDQFQQLIDSLQEGYRKRFGKPYGWESTLSHISVRRLAAEFDGQQREIESALEALQRSCETGARNLESLNRLMSDPSNDTLTTESSRKASIWINRIKRGRQG